MIQKNKKNPITLRGHHLSDIEKEYKKPGSATGFGYELNYGINNNLEVRRLISLILNKDVRVKITDNLDDLCKADCNLLADECSEKKLKEYDRRVAEQYGFQIGKTYSSKELIKKLLVL